MFTYFYIVLVRQLNNLYSHILHGQAQPYSIGQSDQTNILISCKTIIITLI